MDINDEVKRKYKIQMRITQTLLISEPSLLKTFAFLHIKRKSASNFCHVWYSPERIFIVICLRSIGCLIRS